MHSKLPLPDENEAAHMTSLLHEEFSLKSSADFFLTTHMEDRGLTAKGQKTVINILESARSIIVDKGYGNLTLREIARVANISLGNLQYYYPTHDDLIKDLFPLIFFAYEESFNRITFAEDISAEKKFATMVRFLFENSLGSSVSKLFFDIWALSQRSEHVATHASQMYHRFQAKLEAIIVEISPDMPSEKAKERAAMVMFCLEGMMVRMKLTHGNENFVFNDDLLPVLQGMTKWP